MALNAIHNWFYLLSLNRLLLICFCNWKQNILKNIGQPDSTRNPIDLTRLAPPVLPRIISANTLVASLSRPDFPYKSIRVLYVDVSLGFQTEISLSAAFITFGLKLSHPSWKDKLTKNSWTNRCWVSHIYRISNRIQMKIIQFNSPNAPIFIKLSTLSNSLASFNTQTTVFIVTSSGNPPPPLASCV